MSAVEERHEHNGVSEGVIDGVDSGATLDAKLHSHDANGALDPAEKDELKGDVILVDLSGKHEDAAAGHLNDQDHINGVNGDEEIREPETNGAVEDALVPTQAPHEEPHEDGEIVGEDTQAEINGGSEPTLEKSPVEEPEVVKNPTDAVEEEPADTEIKDTSSADEPVPQAEEAVAPIVEPVEAESVPEEAATEDEVAVTEEATVPKVEESVVEAEPVVDEDHVPVVETEAPAEPAEEEAPGTEPEAANIEPSSGKAAIPTAKDLAIPSVVDIIHTAEAENAVAESDAPEADADSNAEIKVLAEDSEVTCHAEPEYPVEEAASVTKDASTVAEEVHPIEEVIAEQTESAVEPETPEPEHLVEEVAPVAEEASVAIEEAPSVEEVIAEPIESVAKPEAPSIDVEESVVKGVSAEPIESVQVETVAPAVEEDVKGLEPTDEVVVPSVEETILDQVETAAEAEEPSVETVVVVQDSVPEETEIVTEVEIPVVEETITEPTETDADAEDPSAETVIGLQESVPEEIEVVPEVEASVVEEELSEPTETEPVSLETVVIVQSSVPEEIEVVPEVEASAVEEELSEPTQTEPVSLETEVPATTEAPEETEPESEIAGQAPVVIKFAAEEAVVEPAALMEVDMTEGGSEDVAVEAPAVEEAILEPAPEVEADVTEDPAVEAVAAEAEAISENVEDEASPKLDAAEETPVAESVVVVDEAETVAETQDLAEAEESEIVPEEVAIPVVETEVLSSAEAPVIEESIEPEVVVESATLIVEIPDIAGAEASTTESEDPAPIDVEVAVEDSSVEDPEVDEVTAEAEIPPINTDIPVVEETLVNVETEIASEEVSAEVESVAVNEADIPAGEAIETPAPVIQVEVPVLEYPAETEDAVPSELTGSGALTPKESEDERPKSPWTPSYSVITQGGADSNAEAHEDEIAELEQLPPLATHQSEPGFLIQEPQLIVHESEDDVTSTDEVSAVSNVVEEFDASSAEPEQPEISTSALSPPTEEAPEERPKSPWTPSYSVTTMGTGLRDPEEEQEIEQLESLPPSIDQPEESTEAIITEPASGVVIEDVTQEPALTEQSQAEDDVLDTAVESDVPITENTLEIKTEPVEDVLVEDVPAEAPYVEEEPAEEVVEWLPLPESSVDPSTLERPKSPWTPSYSVTRTPELPSDEVEEESLPQPELEVNTLPIPEAAIPERPRSPWTPSYSVTRSPDMRAQEVPLVEEPLSEPVLENESLPIPQDDATPERPKSPWTPSYSVSRQGSGVTPEDDNELSQLEQLPEPVAPESSQEEGPVSEPSTIPSIVETLPSEEVTEASVVPEAPSTPQSSLGMSTPTFESQAASPRLEPEVLESEATPISTPSVMLPQNPPFDAETETSLEAEPGINIQEADTVPDTSVDEGPSPSVSPAPAVDAVHEPAKEPVVEPSAQSTAASVGEEDSAPQELQPSVTEDAEDAQMFPTAGKKPSMSTLATIDESNQTHDASSTFLDPGYSYTRGRHESTTSSRFFPGGWFSSSPTIPQEGRPSLDSAAGEFIAPPETQETEEDGKEKKAKWCIIM